MGVSLLALDKSIYYICIHWSFGKCKIRVMPPVLKFGTFFFSSKNFIAKNFEVKNIRSSVTRA